MRLLFVAFAVIFCLLPMNALAGNPNSYTGTWEYRQRNPGTATGYDDEGERLLFSDRNGILEGIYFGLEREGEHGLFYSVVKMKDLRVTDGGDIFFVVPERDLFSERPATLAEAEKKKDGAGFTRHEMKMRGQIEKGRLVLKCTSTAGECPDNVMSFRKGKWSGK